MNKLDQKKLKEIKKTVLPQEKTQKSRMFETWPRLLKKVCELFL